MRRLAVSRGAINGVFLGASADKNGQFGWADGSKMDFENYYPGQILKFKILMCKSWFDSEYGMFVIDESAKKI